MTDRNKPRHELCVDKTSCKSEYENNDMTINTGAAGSSTNQSGPTGHLTKDAIKQQYLQSQQQQEKS